MSTQKKCLFMVLGFACVICALVFAAWGIYGGEDNDHEGILNAEAATDPMSVLDKAEAIANPEDPPDVDVDENADGENNGEESEVTVIELEITLDFSHGRAAFVNDMIDKLERGESLNELQYLSIQVAVADLEPDKAPEVLEHAMRYFLAQRQHLEEARKVAREQNTALEEDDFSMVFDNMTMIVGGWYACHSTPPAANLLQGPRQEIPWRIEALTYALHGNPNMPAKLASAQNI